MKCENCTCDIHCVTSDNQRIDVPVCRLCRHRKQSPSKLPCKECRGLYPIINCNFEERTELINE